ncbi:MULTISPECIES: AraC family transcriptional regulator [Paenibacillus]|uniref:AraC family transcriptional regulator n=1 Tax=Paenibacillus TaxID=44249 RepID=UPI0022B895E6|nr:AraC family transcriptional regulator [Paenibacillus caseinilyticus]MCZ8523220.1 AraC family transcriptional regulator [Paenibacillus caseinilyticus]
MFISGDSAYFQYCHRRVEIPLKIDFHLHDRFEIYFFISGDVHYLVEKNVYPLQYGDLLIMNSRELHKPTFRSDAPYENIVVHFDPTVATALASLSAYPLLDCFVNRPQGEGSRIALSLAQREEALALFRKTDDLLAAGRSGSDLLLTLWMTELLVVVNRAFRENLAPHAAGGHGLHDKLAPVLEYIDRHLEQDLTLESLEGHFYTNRYYLSRLFRRHTGSSIHEYILLKRVALAKKLLKEGCNVTEACQRSGFNDYSHFIRMFKKLVGLPPGQYARGR